MIRKILKDVIADAYEEGYRKGSADIVERMAFIYDVCRERGRADGMAEAGAIDLDDIDEVIGEQFDPVVDDLEF